MCAADFLNPLISATSGLVGVFLGGWLINKREREKRHYDFITRQLTEFYGPIVSMRTEIRARGELRLKIESAMDQKNSRDFLEMDVRGGGEGVGRMSSRVESMQVVRRDEYEIFRDISMPLYREMLKTFREKIWLAQTETRRYFSQLIEFVDVWERHIRGTMPTQVIEEIKHTEQNLHPFYDHMETMHELLQRILVKK